MPEKVKILVTYRGLRERYIRQIREISERIDVEMVPDGGSILDAVRDAEVIFGDLTKEMFIASKKLRWVQVASAGVDRYLFPEIVESDVILTTTSGMHRIPMSELVLAMMLTLVKQLHRFVRLQSEGKWRRINTEELAGKTVGIIGFGNVGNETAAKAKCFGMRVLAIDIATIRRPTYVDEILGPEDLDYVLRESDYLVMTMPLTEKTHHMIGERELRLMKPTAYVVNVARGAVIDNEALLRALKEGWIAGAGLDVFEQEPLPQDSEFWKLNNIVITPHIGGSSRQYQKRSVKIFCGNLRRYLEGKPLMNMVDKKAGY